MVDPMVLLDSFSKWAIGKGATTSFRLFLIAFCMTVYSGQNDIKKSMEVSRVELSQKIDDVNGKINVSNDESKKLLAEYNNWRTETAERISFLEATTGFRKDGWIRRR